MKVVIDVPRVMQGDVRYWLETHKVTFEVSVARRAKFEMDHSETVDNALVGLWTGWPDNRDHAVSVLTIKAT